ncbi:potassium channel family protein [Methylotenera sp. G11]|uniref:potassium channel family protein n=1 Tax=Methylotenera sp. G11 TaxID=1506585 RepID=UPI0006476BD9|nr:potassium channel family protein [Methylotenera sp. G11]
MIAAFALNAAIVAVAVLIHFEALNMLSILTPKIPVRHRLRVLIGVFGALIAHVVEIFLFASGYYFMANHTGFGTLVGRIDNSLMDCMYFSFVNFTTLGLGDIIATGDIRFLTGLEALTGLVLITWTASFVFVEMEKQWKYR